MKIAFVLPKLVNEGPILVVKDLILQIQDKVDLIHVYYFDGENEAEFECACFKISFFKKKNFDEYDIVHSHMLRPDLFIARNKSIIKKAKCVSTLHNDIYKVLRSTFNVIVSFVATKLWCWSLRHQDVIVMLSKDMKRNYEGILKNKVLDVIYNGRDLNKNFSKKVDLLDEEQIIKLKENFNIIGVSARLNKIKGFSQLIKALPSLKEYALVFIGEGEEKDELIELSKELNVYERCLFLGYKFEGFRYLPFFDIYAMTSLSEGFPLGLLEAAQYKLPIVCSNLPIFRELFTENEVSYFEIGNILSLENSIKHLFANKSLFSENIFKKVSENYTVEKMGNNYMELYHRMI